MEKLFFLALLMAPLSYPVTSLANSAFDTALELHSDDQSLSSNINSSVSNVSASVDTVRLLMDSMALQSTVLNVPFTRSLKYIEQQQAVCIVNRIRTPERDEKYLFSLPINFFQTQRLYQLAENPPINPVFLDEQGAVKSIHAVINALPDSTILLPANYSFGHRVDTDLAQVNSHQVIPIANDDYYLSFMRIFTGKRIDFAIIFPVALYRHFGENLPVPIRKYTIANNPEYVTGHFLCGDTPKTRSFLREVNSNIKKLYSKPEYIRAHTAYLPSHSADEISRVISQHANSQDENAIRQN